MDSGPAADEHALVEDGVGPGEVHLRRALRGDALAAQHRVGVAALHSGDHLDPRHPDPLDRPAEFGAERLGDAGLVAPPAVLGGPEREQWWRFGVQACQPQRRTHGASFQYISRSQSVTYPQNRAHSSAWKSMSSADSLGPNASVSTVSVRKAPMASPRVRGNAGNRSSCAVS